MNVVQSLVPHLLRVNFGDFFLQSFTNKKIRVWRKKSCTFLAGLLWKVLGPEQT